jgi:DUF4097 and DUF4098 domain-containing protein YvlB
LKERGRNILPMIGFIMLAGVLLGGFALAKNARDKNMLEPGKSSQSERKSSQPLSENELLPEAKAGNIFGRQNIEQAIETAIDGIDKITIESVSSELSVFYAASDKITSKYYGNVQSADKNAVSYIEVDKKGREAIIKVKYPTWFNISFSDQTKLDVTIPDSWAGDLDINNTSGRINTPELKGKEISLSTISGFISADKLIGENIEINTTSGTVDIGEVTASRMFRGSAISGKYSVNMIDSREVELNTTSGKIDLKNVLCDDIDVDSISGNIDIVMKKGSADIETASGKIKTQFLDEFEKIKVKSISGSVILSIPADSQFEVNISTISGSIKYGDFAMKNMSSEKNELKATVGNGDSRISVNTASGSVQISKNQ